MDKKTKALSRNVNKQLDQRYVLLCAMSADDLPDAQKAAEELASAGKQARVILCGRKNDDLFRLAESGKCIYCGLYCSEPPSDELIKKLNCKVRLYLFLKEERRKGDRRSGDRRTSDDRRTGDRRTASDRRTSDRRSGGGTPENGASAQDNRSGGDRRGTDRRSGDRRNGNRRSGDDRRVSADGQPVRLLYAVFIDESFPKGQQARRFQKSGSDNAVTLADALESEQSAGTVEKDNKNNGAKGYIIALVVAAALGALYFLARLAPYFFSC